MTASTGAPALTMIITLRGLASVATNSERSDVAVMFLPLARPSANFCVTAVVRLKTATLKPLDSMFRTRFSPITASPTSPMSHVDMMNSRCCSTPKSHCKYKSPMAARTPHPNL
jgi:hypothetical protein